MQTEEEEEIRSRRENGGLARASFLRGKVLRAMGAHRGVKPTSAWTAVRMHVAKGSHRGLLEKDLLE